MGWSAPTPMATIRVSLAADAARLRSLLLPMLSVEAGLGADGIGHGQLKPPSEGLLEIDGINPVDSPQQLHERHHGDAQQ